MKILIGAAALLLSAVMLAGCAGTAANSEDTTAKNTITTGSSISDYDASGNLILVSNPDRYVYKTKEGYLIIAFGGEAVVNVVKVLQLADESAANAYMDENFTTLMENGQYTTIDQKGKFVVQTLSLKNADYGYLYTESRSAVESEFASLTTEPYMN